MDISKRDPLLGYNRWNKTVFTESVTPERINLYFQTRNVSWRLCQYIPCAHNDRAYMILYSFHLISRIFIKLLYWTPPIITVIKMMLQRDWLGLCGNTHSIIGHNGNSLRRLPATPRSWRFDTFEEMECSILFNSAKNMKINCYAWSLSIYNILSKVYRISDDVRFLLVFGVTLHVTKT